MRKESCYTPLPMGEHAMVHGKGNISATGSRSHDFLLKSRKRDQLDKIIQMNTIGISKANESNLDEAYSLFCWAFKESEGIMDPHLRELVWSSQLGFSLLTPSSGALDYLTKTRRGEYDEGINNLQSFIDLESFQSGSIESSTVLSALIYNMAQIELRRKHCLGAHQLFLDAYNLAKRIRQKTQRNLAAKCLYNMGCGEYRTGDMEMATKFFAEASTILDSSAQIDSCPKSDQILLASTLNCLGVLYSRRSPGSDGSSSLKCLSRALVIQRTLLSQNHRDIATTLHNLGQIHALGHRFEQAISCYHESLSMRSLLLGPDHIDVAATNCSIAHALQQLGDLDDALVHYNEFLRIALRKFGTIHQDVIHVRKCVANIHYQRGEKAHALALYEDILTCSKACLGTHPEVAAIMSRMGKINFDLGNYTAALDMYKQCLSAECVLFDRDHPNISITLSNIGQISRITGDLKSAICAYQELLAIQKRYLGPVHLCISETLSILGQVYFQIFAYDQALLLFEESLRILCQMRGDDCLEAANLHSSIGLVLFNVNLHDRAIERYFKSLRIKREILGEAHPDLAVLFHNIATIYLELKRYEEAVEYYRECLRISKTLHCPKQEDIILTLRCIAHVHQQRGEFRDSLVCLMEALDLLKCLRPQKSVDIAKALTQIASLNLQLGETREALKFIQEAARLARTCGFTDQVEIEFSSFRLYMIAKLYPEASAAA